MLQDKRLAEVCGLSLAFAGISSSEKYAVIAKALSQSHWQSNAQQERKRMR